MSAALWAALALALLVALAHVATPRGVDQERLLESLRGALLSSQSLRRAHGDVCAALETWRLLPGAGLSRADAGARTIHLVLLDALARPFDRNTLLRALTHEACHAAGHAEHDAAFFRKQDQCLAALARDDVIDLTDWPDFTYPAVIL